MSYPKWIPRCGCTDWATVANHVGLIHFAEMDLGTVKRVDSACEDQEPYLVTDEAESNIHWFIKTVTDVTSAPLVSSLYSGWKEWDFQINVLYSSGGDLWIARGHGIYRLTAGVGLEGPWTNPDIDFGADYDWGSATPWEDIIAYGGDIYACCRTSGSALNTNLYKFIDDETGFVRVAGSGPQGDAPSHFTPEDPIIRQKLAVFDGALYYGRDEKLYKYTVAGGEQLVYTFPDVDDYRYPAALGATDEALYIGLGTRDPAKSPPEIWRYDGVGDPTLGCSFGPHGGVPLHFDPADDGEGNWSTLCPIYSSASTDADPESELFGRQIYAISLGESVGAGDINADGDHFNYRTAYTSVPIPSWYGTENQTGVLVSQEYLCLTCYLQFCDYCCGEWGSIPGLSGSCARLGPAGTCEGYYCCVWPAWLLLIGGGCEIPIFCPGVYTDHIEITGYARGGPFWWSLSVRIDGAWHLVVPFHLGYDSPFGTRTIAAGYVSGIRLYFVNMAWGSQYVCLTGNVGPIREVDFGASPLSGPVPLEVTFDDRTYQEPNSWCWDFGDGENSDEQHPVHTYQCPGTYTVRLSVIWPDGCATKTKEDYITVAAPEANFVGEPQYGIMPLEVQFTDLSPSPGTMVPDSWLWDFGDEETSTDQNPLHTYDEAGWYTVSLTTTWSSCGYSDTETKEKYIYVWATQPILGDFRMIWFVGPVEGGIGGDIENRVNYGEGTLTATGIEDFAFNTIQQFPGGEEEYDTSPYGACDICVNDANVWAAWRTNVTGGAKLYFAKSPDHGSNWSVPSVVLQVSNDPYERIRAVHIERDSSNRLFILVGLGYSSKEYRLYRSNDDGDTWSWVTVAIANGYYNTDLEVDSQGNVYVAYLSSWSLYLKKSSDHGETFGAAVEITAGMDGCWEFDMWIDGYDGIHLLAYAEDAVTGERMYHYLSTDGGETFDGPNLIDDSEEPYGSGAEVFSDGENVYAWWEPDDEYIRFCASPNLGSTWGTPVDYEQYINTWNVSGHNAGCKEGIIWYQFMADRFGVSDYAAILTSVDGVNWIESDIVEIVDQSDCQASCLIETYVPRKGRVWSLIA